MTARRRALAYVALALYFAGCMLAAKAHDVPALAALAGVGMGGSLAVSAVWWVTAERSER